MSGDSSTLRRALRVVVLTDPVAAAPRTVEDVVSRVLSAGVRAVQLRDKAAPARRLAEEAARLLRLTRPAGALLFVNDRLDVALAVGADGVHLGPDDVSVEAARSLAPRGFLIGFSTDDPARAARARDGGADYIGCGAVFGTVSKDVGGEAIGVGRLDAVARAVDIPVVGIGGIGPGNVARVAATRAAGAAVLSSVMGAPDPEDVARRLLAAFERDWPA